MFGTSKTKQCYCQQWRHKSCNNPIGKEIENELKDEILDFFRKEKTTTTKQSVYILL